MVSLNRSAETGFRADRQQSAFTVLELIVTIVIIFVMFVWTVSGGSSVSAMEKAKQTQDLARARQIHIALFNFASDHEGAFPTGINQDPDDYANSFPTNLTVILAQSGASPIKTANDAFANLVPRYMQSEKAFYTPGSAWCPKPPDENINPGKKLANGENGYAYVPCLTSTSNGNFPLIADGFKAGQPGMYTTDQNAKGGVWRGRVAIVIRVDGSAAQEKVDATDHKVYGHTTDVNTPADIFAPAPGWLEPKNLPLNPASK